MHLYLDRASGKKDIRPGLEACLNALRKGDTLVIWKLDRLGCSLHHLVNTVNDLSERDFGLKVLTGTGAQIDTTTPAGRLLFGIFAAARARDRVGGRKFALSKAQVRLTQAAMANRDATDTLIRTGS